jgi:hypothetical protein
MTNEPKWKWEADKAIDQSFEAQRIMLERARNDLSKSKV